MMQVPCEHREPSLEDSGEAEALGSEASHCGFPDFAVPVRTWTPIGAYLAAEKGPLAMVRRGIVMKMRTTMMTGKSRGGCDQV